MSPDFSRIADVEWVLSQHKAVSLLRKEHAPLIIAFCHAVFRARNRQTYAASELIALLSDFLFSANDGGERFPGTPKYYLEQWTQAGFLRQFYEVDQEEATIELTPATEKVLQWVTELDRPEFVGTESRLLQIFDLLRNLAFESTLDKDARLKELLRRRQEIDEEILALEEDSLQRLDPTRIRERYFLVEETAGKLLSDFRQIEANFRQLNTQVREDRITKQGSRGQILDDIFEAHDLIMHSDQGKSFSAFWEFLMDQRKQDELDELIQSTFEQPELTGFRPRSVVPRLKMALVDAGDRVHKTTDRLVEQLRRFLAAKTYLENKRAADVIQQIEELALQVRNEPPLQRNFLSIQHKPIIRLVMDRGLYEPPETAKVDSRHLQVGQADVSTDALYDQLYVDPAALRERIRLLLRGRTQISLREIVEEVPIEKGLSELVAYFGIATAYERNRRATINEAVRETIYYRHDDRTFQVELPQTIFLA